MISRTVAVIFFLSAACAFPQARFDVASIKPSRLSGEGRNRESTVANPGSLAMHNVTLRSALQWAYRMKEYQVSGPAWIGDERYDIAAKAGDTAGEDQLRAMLQNLLMDRFKLTLHRERKELPIYGLLVAKNGPKLTLGNAESKSVMQPNGLSLVAKDTSMGEVADFLTQMAIRTNLPPVVDLTGLPGRYNFTIDPSGFLQSLAGGGKGAPDPLALVNGVQEILQEQLGLKADLRKAPTDILIVDRAEKLPTEN
jgi:uncharacterized protein (TIGR03435 family)